MKVPASLLVSLMLACEGAPGGQTSSFADGAPDGGDALLRECAAGHEKVGQTATLETKFHGVSGIATILDDCTIQIDGFDFDGGGINVQLYGGLAGDYARGFSMSGDLRRETPYVNEVLTVQLPEGLTLDDLDGISVWCVPAGADFGSGIIR